ncbi:GNAT family N-acetyltransferase [Tumebacillus lipolyticus]|uniref:GNAT family N-acetyltransferase n=1 Tax=Tumebacillus lipolyticus TaxID=1280370 RepID=A0ABW4ZVJ3_9BACL
MGFELETVKAEQKEALLNLAEFYIYHFSEIKDIDLNEQGRWDFYPVQTYVEAEEKGKHAFFVRVEGKLAGFVLVSKLSDADQIEHSIDEFFIMAKYRGRGLGQAVATEMFDRFPGRWRAFELIGNVSAISFWRRVIDVYTNGKYQETKVNEGGASGYMQKFSTLDKGSVQS